VLGLPVEWPAVIETMALGAFLAGLAIRLHPLLEVPAGTWRAERRFEPAGGAASRRARLLAGWQDAGPRVRTR
jgi:glycerol kinase